MLIRPYGDTRDDGVIQFSFTLPMPYSVRAADVGKQFLEKLGFHTVGIAECKAIDPEYTLFVAYGRTDQGIDPDKVKGDYLEVEEMDYYAINALVKDKLGRKLSVVGAAIESDAHTVGIDAIMNMKGFAGNYGLERYPEMDALNMGSQIPCAQLLKSALERDADAILVSQIVTQKNIHVQHLTQLIELLEAEGVRERFVIVVGGPRINNAFAKELDELGEVLYVDVLLGHDLAHKDRVGVTLERGLEQLRARNLRAHVERVHLGIALEPVVPGEALHVHDGVDAHGVGVALYGRADDAELAAQLLPDQPVDGVVVHLLDLEVVALDLVGVDGLALGDAHRVEAELLQELLADVRSLDRIGERQGERELDHAVFTSIAVWFD